MGKVDQKTNHPYAWKLLDLNIFSYRTFQKRKIFPKYHGDVSPFQRWKSQHKKLMIMFKTIPRNGLYAMSADKLSIVFQLLASFGRNIFSFPVIFHWATEINRDIHPYISIHIYTDRWIDLSINEYVCMHIYTYICNFVF